MKASSFFAVSPFEIGDKVMMGNEIHTITDICAHQFVKSGKTNFSYELDNSGVYRGYKVYDSYKMAKVKVE